MRLSLLAASIATALLCGCAGHEAAQNGLAKPGAEREQARESREAVNARAPAASGEVIPRGSIQEFNFCLTVGQTAFDQFTCLHDLHDH